MPRGIDDLHFDAGLGYNARLLVVTHKRPSRLAASVGLAWLAGQVLIGSAASAGALREPRHSLAIGATFVSASDPLESGSGPTLHYTQAFGSSDRRPPIMKLELAGYTLDRVAGEVALEGRVELIQISAGVLWPLIRGDSRWGLAVGGGLDLFLAQGEGAYAEAAPISLRNGYEVDSGLGLHAGAELTLRAGRNWKLFLDLRYLAAELDGAHLFLVDDVQGEPLPVDFDLGGPQGAMGVGYRF